MKECGTLLIDEVPMSKYLFIACIPSTFGSWASEHSDIGVSLSILVTISYCPLIV